MQKTKTKKNHPLIRKLLFILLPIVIIVCITSLTRNWWLNLSLDKGYTHDQIKTLTQKVDGLHQRMQTTTPTINVDVQAYTISQVKDAYLLVRTAATSLQHDQDTLVAKQLLQLAADHLANLQGPKIEQAKKILAADQAKLDAVQLPNMKEVQDKLALLDRLVNVMPAYKAVSVEPEQTATPAKSSKATNKDEQPWYKPITSVFADLKTVVRVRKKGEQEASLTDMEMARAQFKLLIEQLRWASFYNNADVYNRSIVNAQELLPRIFDMQSESVKKFSETLQELQKLQIKGDIPNIQDSVNALQAILVG